MSIMLHHHLNEIEDWERGGARMLTQCVSRGSH